MNTVGLAFEHAYVELSCIGKILKSYTYVKTKRESSYKDYVLYGRDFTNLMLKRNLNSTCKFEFSYVLSMQLCSLYRVPDPTRLSG